MRAVINREYLPAVLEMIGSAQKSIHVIQYEYVHYGAVRQIESALIDAVRRGVKVRMILDDTVDHTKKSIDRLKKNGIDVKLDETFSYGEAGDKTTHAKAILVDGEKFILGSTNFSAKSIEDNNEANLYIASPEAGKRFKNYFERLWKNAAAEPTTPAARLGDADLIFNRQYLPTMLDLFQNAKKRIYVVMYSMNMDRRWPSIRRLSDELEKAKSRGVDVRIVLDQSAGSFAEKTLEFNDDAKRVFAKAGIELRLDSKEVITHAKVLIVDDAAVVGGTNWGHGPLDLYNDCNAIVRRPELVRKFSDMFLSLWNAKPETDPGEGY